MPSILFVCTANQCRSPMAEVLFKARFGAELRVQSAGVRTGPRGQPMDARAAAALHRHGFKLEKKWRSRQVEAADFEAFDLILVMEAQHLQDLRAVCPPELQPKLRLLLDFVPGFEGQDLPDPYFGPTQGFDQALALILRSVEGVGAAWPAGAQRPR
jgi:protein-tyrosine phosphatase